MEDWSHELEWNWIAYGTVAGGGVVALILLWLCVPGMRRRFLPMPRLRPGRWLGYDVFLAFCVGLGFPSLLTSMLLQLGFFMPLIGPEPEQAAPDLGLYFFRASYISSPLTLAAVLGFIMAVMYARTSSRPQRYGLTWARWPSNLALGIAVFLVGRPLIIGAYALIVLVFPEQATFLKRFARLDLPTWEWLLFGFHTIIAAALLEEILFRGILQGWLRRATLVGHVAVLFFIMNLAIYMVGYDLVLYDAEAGALVFAWDKIFAVGLTLAAVGAYIYALVRGKQKFGLDEDETRLWQTLPRGPALDDSIGMPEEEARQKRSEARQRDEDRTRRWAEHNANLAIFGSALLFAVVHPWPGPIALFPMGLALGWMRQRTQSLVGPIVFHALFNLTTFIAFYGSTVIAPR